jgi:hypothetical protein
VDWVHVAQNRERWRDFVKNGDETSGSIKGDAFLASAGFSRQTVLDGVEYF